jgi:predicted kinase
MAQFLMTIGISGSGKSTYLKKFPKEGIICPDDIRRELTGDISDQSQNARVWAVAKERVLERLARGEDTVLDATNTVSRNRKNFLEDIPKDAELVAVVFPLPDLGKAFQRIQEDIKNGVDRSDVPFDVIQRQADQYNNGLMNVKDQFDRIIFLKEDLTEMIVTGTNKV